LGCILHKLDPHDAQRQRIKHQAQRFLTKPLQRLGAKHLARIAGSPARDVVDRLVSEFEFIPTAPEQVEQFVG
jgi:hypothetical protein